MRTLTLGILIVSGGTLAALPFRRYQSIPDASSAPVQATGPMQSVLDTMQSERNKVTTLACSEERGEPVPDAERLAESLPRWPQPSAPPRRRPIDIPLTYDDLTEPIDLPVAIERRFNATAVVRERQLERERVVGLVMPHMESLAASQLEDLRVATATAAELSSGAVSSGALSSDEPATISSTGKLASATSPHDKNAERLSEIAPDQRERHWIRQPD